jgi:O-Antigen ligase
VASATSSLQARGALPFVRWMRLQASSERLPPFEGLAQLAGASVLTVLAGFLVVQGHVTRALAVALIPLLFSIANRTRLVYAAVVMPILGATLVFGRAFTELPVERVYILDATLILAFVLTLPATADAASRFPGVTTVLLLLIGIALADIAWAGATRIVLRQSVLVLYSLWVFVGLAMGRMGLVGRFAHVVYWSAIGTAVLGVLLHAHLVHLSLVPVARSLYIGYGLLLVMFAPELIPRNRWVTLVIVLQLVIVGLDKVRSVWIAFPLAVVSTLLITGSAERIRRQIVKLTVILATLIVVAGVIFPTVLNALGREAASIVSYSGNTASDANAKWRLTNWHYGLSEIKKHSLTGIQLGGPEVPPSVCKTGCNRAGLGGDSTVLAGADLHNSILAIPLRFGIPAFLLFIVFELTVLARARRAARRSSLVRWLLACHLLTLFTALTAVVLEGPYMGIFFWLTGGLVIGVSSFSPSGSPEATNSSAAHAAVGGRP